MAATTNLTMGTEGIRRENIESGIKGFTEQSYKLKQVCLVQSSSSHQETYWKEDTDVLTGMTGSSIDGIPRGAQFPHVEPNWTKQTGYFVKYGDQGKIFYEDLKTDQIDVQARTMKRVAQAITAAIDGAIYSGIVDATGINTLAASATWDNATIALQNPIGDILHGIEYCSVDNVDILENGYIIMAPEDYTNLLNNSKVINNPSFKTADVVSNGKVGQICGLTIIVTNSATINKVTLIKGQSAAVWKSNVGLTAVTIDDPGIKITIRAWEIGQLQIVNPNAIHVITSC